jgi:hypothetical protein
MVCKPPYYMGTGGYCGCNCKCCPPLCYKKWTYVYLCGTNNTQWQGIGNAQGCDCPSGASFALPLKENKFTKNLPSLEIDFPDFEYPQLETFSFDLDEEENSKQKVSALALNSACTIPCTTVTITVTTTGCCLYGSGFSFNAVNSGIISISGCLDTCGEPFGCSINGNGTSTFVGDGGAIDVIISPPSSYCCSCCLISSYGTPLNQNPNGAFTKRNTITGATKNYININKRKLLEKIYRQKNIKK